MKIKDLKEILEALNFVADAYRNRDFCTMLNGENGWIEITERQKKILDMFQMTEIKTTVQIPKKIEDYRHETSGEMVLFRTEAGVKWYDIPGKMRCETMEASYYVCLEEHDFFHLILIIRAMESRLNHAYKHTRKDNEK